jgi:predicted short-subunit dehydrogenase-like oxidoreductase (DUF2520 family)
VSRARPNVAFIGAGGLARALAPSLSRAGYPVVGIFARSPRTARRDPALRGFRLARDPADAVAKASLVLLAVPDGAVETVARQLARTVPTGWRRRIVLHHAGALGIEPLRALAERGAAVGLLHPLQAFSVPAGAKRRLRGSRARIAGDARAARMARRLAKDLGLVPLEFARPLRPADRSAYHAAASIASNDLLALLSLATRALRAAGAGRGDALRALLPLVRGTLDQAEAVGLERALTGPVVRGDARTVRSQISRLERLSREAAEVHRLLSREILRLRRSDEAMSRLLSRPGSLHGSGRRGKV